MRTMSRENERKLRAMQSKREVYRANCNWDASIRMGHEIKQFEADHTFKRKQK